MSRDNQLWGAPRIHGEFLRLGIEISRSTVAKYMVRRTGPPSLGWRAFLRSNYEPEIAALDLCVVPTLGFRLLYGLVFLRHDRRRLISFAPPRLRPRTGSPRGSPKPSPGKARPDS